MTRFDQGGVLPAPSNGGYAPVVLANDECVWLPRDVSAGRPRCRRGDDVHANLCPERQPGGGGAVDIPIYLTDGAVTTATAITAWRARHLCPECGEPRHSGGCDDDPGADEYTQTFGDEGSPASPSLAPAECPECEGSGWIDDPSACADEDHCSPSMRCSACDGTGSMKAPADDGSAK